jgi:oligopeptide transport system permease protein
LALTFLVIATVCFLLIKLLPLPAIKEQGRDVALILQRREALGYGKPIYVQYYRYWKHLLQGDLGLGEQMYVGQEVADIIKSKIPYTVSVNFYAIALAIPIGLGLGIYAALRKNKWQDHLISTAVVLFISVPSYVYAFLVQYLLCYRTGWFPLTAASRQEAALISLPMLKSMFPAVLSLAFGTIAALSRFARAELADAMTGEYMLLARTKGLSRSQLIRRHGLRNAMVPILPMIISQFVGILGGSFVIEKIFAVPGVGQLYLQSITLFDYDVFMVDCVFYVFIGLLAGIVVDLSYGFIDPRIRMGE